MTHFQGRARPRARQEPRQQKLIHRLELLQAGYADNRWLDGRVPLYTTLDAHEPPRLVPRKEGRVLIQLRNRPITELPTSMRGVGMQLCLVIDLWSGKVMA